MEDWREYIKLQCVIPDTFLEGGYMCHITQYYGEVHPKNGFHTGIDIRTRGTHKYKKDLHNEVFVPQLRTGWENEGRIRLIAANTGTIQLLLSKDKEEKGWGLFINTKVTDFLEYRTLYWHIETPWTSLEGFRGAIESIDNLREVFNGKQVKAGANVSIAGNNGNSSGPHVHFCLDIRDTRISNQYRRVNPLPFFDDPNVIYKGWDQYHYRGNKLKESEYELALKTAQEYWWDFK